MKGEAAMLRYLGVIAGVLIILFGISFLVDPASAASRGDLGALVDRRELAQVDEVRLGLPPAPVGQAGADGSVPTESDPGSGVGGTGTVVLVRSGSEWVLRSREYSYAVKAQRMADLFAALSSEGPYQPVAHSEGALRSLALDTASARSIELYRGGAAVARILVGRSDETGKFLYIRFADRPESYRGPDRLSWFLSGGTSAWLDLKVFRPPLNPADIQELRLSGRVLRDGVGDLTADFSIRRDTAARWVVVGNPKLPLDPTKAETLSRAVADLEAEGPAETRTGKEPISAGKAALVVVLGDGRNITLSIGPQVSGKGYPLRVDPGGQAYYLSQWAVENIFRPLPALLRSAAD